ncbi:hypothetical protein Nans01_25980 [Nocardiopsis ansamitocini]|uniref:Uncharacterized protein n=1 Tax=Nocardiopsis ansamitocini TaxID=1670832 RepID=A0A9W6P744_9ACTN|nr:hypothetical protein Nans01_25980 [Nocardiopsis ansamitocini]
MWYVPPIARTHPDQPGGFYSSPQHPVFQGAAGTVDFELLKLEFFKALDKTDGNVTGAARAVGVRPGDARAPPSDGVAGRKPVPVISRPASK